MDIFSGPVFYHRRLLQLLPFTHIPASGKRGEKEKRKKNSHNEKVECKRLPLTPPGPELTHVATDVPTRGSGNCNLQLGGHASGEKL